jgi:hypothetical protein
VCVRRPIEAAPDWDTIVTVDCFVARKAGLPDLRINIADLGYLRLLQCSSHLFDVLTESSAPLERAHHWRRPRSSFASIVNRSAGAILSAKKASDALQASNFLTK